MGFNSRQHSAFFREALERIRALPGVQEAAVTGQYPLGGLNNAANQMRLADGTYYRPRTLILLDGVSPGYFRTMGVRLLKGRSFAESDSADAPRVAILSESFARQAFKERILSASGSIMSNQGSSIRRNSQSSASFPMRETPL